MTAPDAETLADLARRLDRLRPSHRDPEWFHTEKSEIAAELRRLARATREAAAQPLPADPRRARKVLLRMLWRLHYGTLARSAAAKAIAPEWRRWRRTGDPLPGSAHAIYDRLDRAGFEPLRWRQIDTDLDEALDLRPAANWLQSPPHGRPDGA